MNYTTTIEKSKFEMPIGEFDEQGRIVYNKYEYYDIDVLDVKMKSLLKSKEEVKKLAELLYPELIKILGDNKYIGVRVLFERQVKFIFSNGNSFDDFQNSLLRQYIAMRFDVDTFGLAIENPDLL